MENADRHRGTRRRLTSGAALLVSLALMLLFNHKLGQVPPPGKFFDPVHGFMANAESSRDLASYACALPGPVQGNIYMDDRLVPHIYAKDAYSLFYLQGYVTAKYRLWQMETETRAAAGRLSEVLGPSLLSYDRLQRRLGMDSAAENALSALEKDSLMFAFVSAYTSGVNAYIQSLSYEAYPLEYKLLDYRPEPWSPLKCMYLLKYMARDLAGFDDDVPYTHVLAMIGRRDFDLLFPDRPEGIDPIIPTGTSWNFSPIQVDTASDCFPAVPMRPDSSMASQQHNEKGSNNWAVAPSRTADGYAILCNDPHLQLNLPSIWYEVQLDAPGIHVYGASLPGAPAVVVGFNDSIAWGETNAGRDVQDWFQMTFEDASRQTYRYGDSVLHVVKKPECFHVRGAKEFWDTVYYTLHGPMVYRDFASAMQDRADMSMQWQALYPSDEFRAIYMLNVAKNYDDYRQAITYFECPGQNFVFASHCGDIAITQQGKFPVEWKEQGKFVLNGNDPLCNWQAFIPFAENPTIKDPERGFVSSANQYPADSTYPYYYYGFDFEFFRNHRINAVLSQENNITIQDMENLQQDNFNSLASDILPLMMQAVAADPRIHGDPAVTAILDTLHAWNYFDDPDITAPTYFQIWWDTLYTTLWDEFRKPGVSLIRPDFYNTMRAMHDLPQDFAYYDILATPGKETLNDVIDTAFSCMMRIVETIRSHDPGRITWYAFKDTRIMHLLQIPVFSVSEVHNGGYRNIINASSQTHGPSWRMVVEMSSPVKAYGIYPGGQSGNPGSRYYADFIPDWAAGKYYALHFFATEAAAKDASQFVIQVNE